MTETPLKTLADAPEAPKELIFGDTPYDVFRRMREQAPIARTDMRQQQITGRKRLGMTILP